MSWHNHLSIHPANALIPSMGVSDLAQLGYDIATNGQREAVTVIKKPNVPRRETPLASEVELLDGKNRLNAREARNLPIIAVDGRLAFPINVIEFDPEFDAYAFVISANLYRLHLTRKQKRKLLRELILRNPLRSDHATGPIVGASENTARSVRRELEAEGEIEPTDTRIDTLGRNQPSTHTRRPQFADVNQPQLSTPPVGNTLPEPEPETSDIDDWYRDDPPTSVPSVQVTTSQDISRVNIAFAALLNNAPAETLEALVRMLNDNRLALSELPKHKRISWIRGYMLALGVTKDDL